jgi:hypothetical protein
MGYSVCAFEEYETVSGMMEEKPLQPVNARTSDDAEKIARTLFEEGKYSSIYIQHTHRDSPSYWNPAVGFEIVGKDWITHFENQ